MDYKDIRTSAQPGFPLRRRAFLLGTTALCLSIPFTTLAQQDVAIDLDAFLAMSTVLTASDVSGERVIAQRYLDALLAQADGAAQLRELWQLGGFAGAEPPRTVAELQQRGVYANPSLQALADTITLQWYSGTYVAADGTTRVATYTTALAWRALPYRPAGPSTCGGAFGHWAERPEA